MKHLIKYSPNFLLFILLTNSLEIDFMKDLIKYIPKYFLIHLLFNFHLKSKINNDHS
jgi:hypothetical protein